MAGIKDVAARAGVSISTVSYVMSGKRSVKEETRLKVLRAARELGYRTSGQTRAIHGGWTKVLALSSPLHEYTDYSNYAIFFFALATRAKRYGYDILLLMHEYGDRELTRIARSGMVDGILLLDVLMTDSRAEVAAMLDVPVSASDTLRIPRRCIPWILISSGWGARPWKRLLHWGIRMY